MKSMVMKSIYAGLGMLGSGKHSVEHLARELAKKAQLSEKEGEKIAHDLKHRSEKAIGTVQKTLNAEVSKVVRALRETTKTVRKAKPSSKAKRRVSRRPKRTSTTP